MVDGESVVIMHKRGGVKWLSPRTERKIRDVVKGERGPEIRLGRKGVAFLFDIDVEDEKRSDTKDQEVERKKPRRPARTSSNCKMDVDAAAVITGGQHEALQSDEDEEIQRQGCDEGFHHSCGIVVWVG